MNPLLKQYLASKLGANYEQDKEAALNDAQSNSRWGNLLGDFGDVVAGKSVGSTDAFFNAQKSAAKNKYADKEKSALADYDIESKMKSDRTSQEMAAKEADPMSQESKLVQSLAVKMGMPQEQAVGLTAAKWKQISPALEKMYQIEQNKISRQDALNTRAQERADKREEKMSDKELKLAVPGFARTGEVMPSEQEAQKFRKATAVSDQLTKKLDRMKELVKSHGSFEYGGTAGQEMEALATEIQLLGKSPELYELGVLTGPDLTLLEKITSDPTSMSSLFTRDKTRQKQIDTQVESLKQKLQSTSKSLGYKSKDEAPQKKIVKTQTNSATGEKRVVYEDGSVEILKNIGGL